ncbi:hypothetical protein SL950_22795 [Klebsiella pneumoniae]|jgi:hypothetical protein|uniref:hypothetical protein n=1 Tax=Klebsiella pneumoniae complex TaxID=3390273 RepID=UPI0003BF35DB|nr:MULTISPECIES: hypothetical protein [Klebsiella]HCB1082707.1 hypothetical protein [Klebsiella variicola subsp. variicola]ELA0881580.1 hypothetical protein [Klebsiella variicola]ELA1952634.1 hypothetical protein [Klebsiella variicola]ESN58759.1 hypothetical protein L363_02132 [Klebsiella pneumoniae MGH 17]MBT0582331.1 hypothetical protein [Klebsiella pneumoniae]
MDPITLSTVASVLLKAGPSLVRTVGGWFGGDSDTAKAADSVASIVEAVNSAINPADQQRVLEQKLAQLPPEQLVQLETLKVQLQQFQLERDKAQMADQQAAHHEQQETIRNGDNATDEYVRQTRPLMARLSLYSSIAYVMVMSLGQQAGAVAGAFGHAFSMPAPDWDISLMLATPALGYLGFRTLDGFARYSKSSKHKVMVGK